MRSSGTSWELRRSRLSSFWQRSPFIATLVPGVGPSAVPDAVTAAASLALALLAAVTIREGRRESHTELVHRKLERLYTPLYHEVVASQGRIYGPKEGRGANGIQKSVGPYWENYVMPVMSANLHLASPELVEVYWRVTRSNQTKELAKEFCDRVRMDYHSLVSELARLGGTG